MQCTRSAAGIVLFAAMVHAGPAVAKKNKVAHTNVVPASWAGDVDPGIGTVTDLEEEGGVLYAAGATGIAAIDASGAVKWKTDLPASSVRNLTVADGVVAWSGFTVAGVDSSEGLQKFLLGKIGDEVSFTDASYGAIDPASGTVNWTVTSDEQASLSPPGISPSSIGIMRRSSFVALDRATGAELGRYDMKMMGMKGDFFSGIYDQAVRIQPAVMGDHFYTGLFSHLIQLDLNGNFVDKTWGNGLTAFVTITCGPVVFDDQVMFGSSGDTQIPNMYFGVNKKIKGTFKEPSPDTLSGCSSALVDGGGVLMASNFYVVELNEKGKVQWVSVNKKGGLYPSSLRGIRYLKGSWPVRKSYSDMVVTDGSRIYVSTDNGHDVITVLDRAGGAYLQTVDVNETIQALAPIGGKVAVATGSHVKMLPGVP